MSTNQRVRLFVAARDLAKALCSRSASQERLFTAIMGMQTELAMATVACRTQNPTPNAAHRAAALN